MIDVHPDGDAWAEGTDPQLGHERATAVRPQLQSDGADLGLENPCCGFRNASRTLFSNFSALAPPSIPTGIGLPACLCGGCGTWVQEPCAGCVPVMPPASIYLHRGEASLEGALSFLKMLAHSRVVADSCLSSGLYSIANHQHHGVHDWGSRTTIGDHCLHKRV